MKHIEEEFSLIEKEYVKDDKNREELIKLSRDILKPSKQAIFSVHRGDLDNAQSLLTAAKNIIDTTETIEYDTGSVRAAIEEYVEAKCFYSFVDNGVIPTRAELCIASLMYETYLAALSDFTGELARLAVIEATRKNINKVHEIYKTIEFLHGLFLKFDFRSGELRKKNDSIKYNLQKVESIVYDMSK